MVEDFCEIVCAVTRTLYEVWHCKEEPPYMDKFAGLLCYQVLFEIFSSTTHGLEATAVVAIICVHVTRKSCDLFGLHQNSVFWPINF